MSLKNPGRCIDMGPDKNKVHPNPDVPSVCIIKNVVRNPNVWIGENVTLLPGVRIGDGAIVGANSVVAGDIAPYSIAVGNPCRVVKKRFDDETIRKLLQLRWWDWEDDRIFENLGALTGGGIEDLR